jgi:serine/threonine-protein kinase
MGRDLDGRSDIFSLGAVLYEMLTGQYAFDGDSLPSIVFRVINESPTPAASLRAHLPAALQDLLTRMLHKDPDQRPNARTVVGDLHALAAGMKHVPVAPRSNRVSRWLPALAFGTPLGVFLLIGLSFIVIEHFLDASRRPVVTPASQNAPPSADAAADTSPEVPVEDPGSEEPDPTGSTTAIQADDYLIGLDKKLVELRIKRTELLLEYTDKYPDVVQIDRQLELLQQERRKHVRQLQKAQQR